MYHRTGSHGLVPQPTGPLGASARKVEGTTTAIAPRQLCSRSSKPRTLPAAASARSQPGAVTATRRAPDPRRGQPAQPRGGPGSRRARPSAGQQRAQFHRPAADAQRPAPLAAVTAGQKTAEPRGQTRPLARGALLQAGWGTPSRLGAPPCRAPRCRAPPRRAPPRPPPFPVPAAAFTSPPAGSSSGRSCR